ncbi:type II secretion system protein [Nitrospira sp. T9]|uniref:type II secretion system protein n=1 Tax=unclassified Nitrospira TaxID=2652172 RepID=UPI003F972176
MAECWWNKPSSAQRGVTLIELLVTLVIMFILASVALPIAKVGIKRSQELELRHTLRTVRTAIDAFQLDWARDGATLLGPLCVKNKLTCKEETGITGYPKTLETLLKVELTGDEAQLGEGPKIRRYLRKIPFDPITETTEWGLRCFQDEPDESRWCGEDVFDIYTTSEKKAIDGTPYREW